jgi:hypothetical protein
MRRIKDSLGEFIGINAFLSTSFDHQQARAFL